MRDWTRRTRVVVSALVCSFALACSGEPPKKPNPGDETPATPPATSRDAGAPAPVEADASAPNDAGSFDASTEDVGDATPEIDAAIEDAAIEDAAIEDAAIEDAGIEAATEDAHVDASEDAAPDAESDAELDAEIDAAPDVEVDAGPPPPTCTDQTKNGDETDQDCGGSCPTKCVPSQGCSIPSDCTSGVCADFECSTPSCFDNVKNGAEKGVDCGGGCAIPCDPSTVAPTLDPTVPFDFFRAFSWLCAGPNALQIGCTATLSDVRLAVVRGKVLDRTGGPLEGVKVSIQGAPEYGYTVSRHDGLFDMAVNGGGPFVIEYTKDGYLPAQRRVGTPWRDFAWSSDVALVELDSNKTVVDFSLPITTAQGSLVTDGDGTRQATLMFAQGTTATMKMPNGSTQPLATITVRATEYTVGATGPAAMPGDLPEASAYTYATEFSIDEAMAAGASEVAFSKPVAAYVDNFIGIPVGQAVPSGYYDRAKAAWVPSPDGKVIKVLSTGGGVADLDIDGDGIADDATKLAALGVSDAERAELAAKYSAGKTLWRVPVAHFSLWDFNYPWRYPTGATPPNQPTPDVASPDCDGCTRTGSIIDVQNSTLGETVPVQGTPFSLHYSSDRVPGRASARKIDIPLTGSTVPAPLERVDLEVLIAGKRFFQSFDKNPNQRATFAWDGKDAYGRDVQGPEVATVRVGYVYRPLFGSTGGAGAAGFGAFAAAEFSTYGRSYVVSWQTSKVTLQAVGGMDQRSLGLGGFSLSPHHVYASKAQTMYPGYGGRENQASIGRIVTTHHVGFSPADMVVMPDKTIFYNAGATDTLWRVNPDGTAAMVLASNGGFALALGPDGNLYTLGGWKLNRITPAGQVTIVKDWSGGLPHGFPRNLDVARDGSIYVTFSPSCLGQVTIMRIAPGGAEQIYKVTGGSDMCEPDVAVAADGSVFYGSYRRIRRLGVDGKITDVAGQSAAAYEGDGVPATSAKLLNVKKLAAAPDGSLYVADGVTVRHITSDGIIRTIAGSGGGYGTGGGEKLPARDVSFRSNFTLDGALLSIALSPDGEIFVGERTWVTNKDWIRRISAPLPGYGGNDMFVPSRDGAEVHRFDKHGRHVSTLDAVTGIVRMTFAYDSAGRLASLTDLNGNKTTLERDASGNAAAIVAPGGQKTTLTLTSEGFLSSVTDAAGRTTSFGYGAGGLLSTKVAPGGLAHEFTYDSDGNLVTDKSPTGFAQTLSRSRLDSKTTWTLDGSGGLTTSYSTETFSDRSVQRKTIDALLAATISTKPLGGSTSLTLPDGSTIALEAAPDSRWGMGAAFEKKTVMTTPGIGSVTATRSREVTLASALNPFSATLQKDTLTVNGRVSKTEWNVTAKTITRTSPAGRVATTTLDASGRPVSYKADAAITSPVTVAYDAFGRVSNVSQGAMSSTTTYDSANRPVATVDALGRSSAFEYDAADRLTAVVMPNGGRVELGYDAAALHTTVKVPSGSVHTFDYEADGQFSKYTLPGGASMVASYDAARRPVALGLADGRVTQFSYDVGGRLVAASFPEGTTNRSYVGATTLLASTMRTPTAGPAQSVAFTYAGAQVTGITFTGPAMGAYTFAYDLSAGTTNLQIVSRSLDGSAATTFSYDNDGLLTAEGPFSLVRGGPAGAVSAIQVGSVTHWSYAFDALGRRVRRSLDVSGSKYSSQLSFDAASQVVTKIETVNGAAAVTYAYAYDLAGQLTEVKTNDVVTETYAYDANGNRTSRLAGASTESATFDSQDRVVARGGVSYEHDAAGFMTKRGTDTFSYSTRGELLSATVGANTVTYAYDASGQRVARTDASGTTQYLYAQRPFYLTHSRAPDGTTTEYFYDDAGRLYALRRAGASYFVATDEVGSPRIVVDAAGAVVMTADYDSFGVLKSGSPAAFEIPIGFAGGLRDSVTGLVRFGYRDYEPESGRWTSRDPALMAADSNGYRYVLNAPIIARDPNGLEVLSLVRHSEQAKSATAMAALQRKEPNALIIQVGGDPTKGLAVNDDNKPITPEQLAREVAKKTSWKRGQKIILVMCHAGQVLNPNEPPFAQRFADLMNADVWAPDDAIRVTGDGNYQIGTFTRIGGDYGRIEYTPCASCSMLQFGPKSLR